MLADATLADQLPNITCPVLLIAGTHDSLRPPSLIEPLAATMQNARFQALDTSHFMAVQTPGIVAKAINAFLAPLGC